VSRLETLSSVCFLWITVISNCFGGPVRKLLRVRRSTSILTAILREVNGAEIRRQDALRDAGQAGAKEENSSSASQYPAILTRLEMGRDVCFVGLTANSNRFGVAIRMGLGERWSGRKLPRNVDLRAWEEKRRQDAGATSEGRASTALEEMNSGSSREYTALVCRAFDRPSAVRSGWTTTRCTDPVRDFCCRAAVELKFSFMLQLR
jgi:hypothetical protein